MRSRTPTPNGLAPAAHETDDHPPSRGEGSWGPLNATPSFSPIRAGRLRHRLRAHRSRAPLYPRLRPGVGSSPGEMIGGRHREPWVRRRDGPGIIPRNRNHGRVVAGMNSGFQALHASSGDGDGSCTCRRTVRGHSAALRDGSTGFGSAPDDAVPDFILSYDKPHVLVKDENSSVPPHVGGGTPPVKPTSAHHAQRHCLPREDFVATSTGPSFPPRRSHKG